MTLRRPVNADDLKRLAAVPEAPFDAQRRPRVVEDEAGLTPVPRPMQPHRIVTNGAGGYAIQKQVRVLWWRWWVTEVWRYDSLEGAIAELNAKRRWLHPFDMVVHEEDL
jgi:hypothetical protein